MGQLNLLELESGFQMYDVVMNLSENFEVERRYRCIQGFLYTVLFASQ